MLRKSVKKAEELKFSHLIMTWIASWQTCYEDSFGCERLGFLSWPENFRIRVTKCMAVYSDGTSFPQIRSAHDGPDGKMMRMIEASPDSPFHLSLIYHAKSSSMFSAFLPQ